MHMADALISPAVGGTVWAASAGLIVYCSKKIRNEMDDRKIPLMGVCGAFIFAAQMINFTIPGTGSSGHLGGAMILSILLGPYAAFLSMASILTVQALIFADGGLLALGCNIFNLGFFPCFIAYPFIYKPIVGEEPAQTRILFGAVAASVIGLQMGAFGVVVETFLSGLSEIPFQTFVLLMQPIHLVIGIVEGVVTAAVISFVWRSRPELLQKTASSAPGAGFSARYVLTAFLLAAFITGGVVTWFASSNPDGLEWALFKSTGKEGIEAFNRNHYPFLEWIQGKTAFFPDYDFKGSGDTRPDAPVSKRTVQPGTSVSGLVGGAVVLLLSICIGFALKRKKDPDSRT
jgi:cobalt/nickel transport system permease protein